MIPQDFRGENIDYSYVQDAIVAASDSFYRDLEEVPRPRYVYFGNIPVNRLLSDIGIEALTRMTPGLQQYGGFLVLRTGSGSNRRCTIREFNQMIRGIGRQVEAFSKRTTIISLQPVIPEVNGFSHQLETILIETGKFQGDYEFNREKVPA